MDAQFVAYGDVADSVAAYSDLPAAGTCEGEFYVTGEGDDTVLWLATGGAWVRVVPQEE